MNLLGEPLSSGGHDEISYMERELRQDLDSLFVNYIIFNLRSEMKLELFHNMKSGAEIIHRSIFDELKERL